MIVEPLSGLTLEFGIQYRVLSEPISLKFLYNDTSVIVYESVINYKRAQTDELQQIFNDIQSKHTYQLIQIISCAISLAIALVLSIIYIRLAAKSKKQSLLGSYDNMDSVEQ